MRRWDAIVAHWRALVVLAIVDAALIVCSASLPDLPGDVALARLIQSAAPMPVGVAQWITATADKPGCFVLLGLTFLAAWLISGWRAAILSLVVFFGLWLFGIWLSPIAAQPRPSPDLINVVGHPKGYAFPSIFGLVYIATFGYLGILGASECGSSTPSGALMIAAAVVILAIGAVARIDLGAHWPSDLWVAYLIGFWWILLLLPLARRPRSL
jgi:membrane-associated phospholipid phosphatase